MSRKSRKLLFCAVPVVVLVCVTSVVLITRASSATTKATAKGLPPARAKDGPRNLWLQPEALRVSRRLGKRYSPSARGASVMVGMVTIGGNERPVTITRRQTEHGEDIKLDLPGKLLTWTIAERLKAGPNAPSETERLLAERLIYDSPDCFVLAQLRGASYLTVAQNVRPENAADDYTGPLWTVVRVEEPRATDASDTNNNWRLYYINSQTGLIDRIVSQLGGQTVEAEVILWQQQHGETSPSRMNWSTSGQLIMSYQANSISYIE